MQRCHLGAPRTSVIWERPWFPRLGLCVNTLPPPSVAHAIAMSASPSPPLCAVPERTNAGKHACAEDEENQAIVDGTLYSADGGTAVYTAQHGGRRGVVVGRQRQDESWPVKLLAPDKDGRMVVFLQPRHVQPRPAPRGKFGVSFHCLDVLCMVHPCVGAGTSWCEVALDDVVDGVRQPNRAVTVAQMNQAVRHQTDTHARGLRSLLKHSKQRAGGRHSNVFDHLINRVNDLAGPAVQRTESTAPADCLPEFTGHGGRGGPVLGCQHTRQCHHHSLLAVGLACGATVFVKRHVVIVPIFHTE